VAAGSENVEEVRRLIDRATASRSALAEKHRAFGEIVKRFQDLAFGCAYAVLGDFQLAEDAAQEAFVTAWRNLEQLRAPEAFPGWLKRIVLTQCSRLTRGKRVDTVSLDAAVHLPSPEPDPLLAAEQGEFREDVLRAIEALPPNERMVTTLFYINDYSQNEIAAFLEVPVTTVKKRLFCARKQLRERMLPMVRDTLQERRPSKDDQFADTIRLFNEALAAFVGKLKQDHNILAAILYGSLSHDTVWEKSDIDILLVGREEKKPVKDFYLVENGINIHATLLPRGKFKERLEGSLQSSFFHSAFSKSTLLYSTDPTLEEYYHDVQRVGARDRDVQLLREGSPVLYTLAKAEKWFHVKKDLTYSFLWVMYSVTYLAKIETLLHGEVTGREVVHQALKHNPRFFRAVYTDLVHGPKDAAAIGCALTRINDYLGEKIPVVFKPILDYLREEGGIRSTTEMDEHFKKRAQIHSLAMAYEWLADKGVIQKVPSPIRLTEKSRVTLEEAAYYYDGGEPGEGDDPE
jgi:RNA polymerase sigma factor (sigma-70 family)